MSQAVPMNMQIITAYGGNFLIPSETDCIGGILKRTGQFETNDIKRVGEYLDQARQAIGKRKLFIDIGANIGTHSLSALKENGYEELFAIEPSKQNYSLLTANLCLSDLMQRSYCIQAAASDHEGASTLYHNPNNCGDHRLNNNPQGNDIDSSGEGENVKTINIIHHIKERIAEKALDDVLCWVDTQGHEIPILRSIHSLMIEGLPVVIEFWPFGMERQSTTIKQLSELLRHPELKIAQINEHTIEELSIQKLETLWKKLRSKDTET
jgi:FkbM family methyltransferase